MQVTQWCRGQVSTPVVDFMARGVQNGGALRWKKFSLLLGGPVSKWGGMQQHPQQFVVQLQRGQQFCPFEAIAAAERQPQREIGRDGEGGGHQAVVRLGKASLGPHHRVLRAAEWGGTRGARTDSEGVRRR
eukprot:gene11202-biopygen8133